MRKQDFLLNLIKSLSAAEIRNFKLLGNLHGGDREYIRLFEILENRETYDARALCQELDVTPEVLVERKRYLGQILLKSIRFFKDGASPEAFVSNSLLEAKELVLRGMNDYALEILYKALVTAKEEEILGYIPQIISLQSQIYYQLGRYQQSTALEKDFDIAQQVFDEHLKLLLLTAHVAEFEQTRKEPHFFAFHHHPLLKINPGDIQSARAQMGWFTLLNLYSVATKKNTQHMLNLVRREAAFYETNPRLKTFAPHQYLHSQIRLATSEGQAGNYSNAWQANEKLLEMLQVTKKTAPPLVDDMRLFAHYIKANLLFHMGNYPEGLVWSEKVYAQRHLMVDYISYTVVFDYAKVLMLTQQTADAIVKLDELLQINTQLRSDLQPYIRPLLMLAHLDLGNDVLVAPLVKSTRSWMKRHKIVNKEVDVLISRCYSIAQAPGHEKRKNWFKLKADLENGSMPMLDREIHLGEWIQIKLTREVNSKSPRRNGQ